MLPFANVEIAPVGLMIWFNGILGTWDAEERARFATGVVLLTVNGGVPVATVETSVAVVVLPVVSTLNLLTPLSRRSINREPGPAPMSLTFSNIPASTAPDVLQMGRTDNVGVTVFPAFVPPTIWNWPGAPGVPVPPAAPSVTV